MLCVQQIVQGIERKFAPVDYVRYFVQLPYDNVYDFLNKLVCNLIFVMHFVSCNWCPKDIQNPKPYEYLLL
jgi:hypothetical protein